MWIEYNPNPRGLQVGDCVIRAACKILGMSWDEVYSDLCIKGMQMADMPSANRVWGSYLHEHGFRRLELPDSCPDCYRVCDFCADHRDGAYILATGTHVIAVMNGNFYDAWDSGNEIPTYYWSRNV